MEASHLRHVADICATTRGDYDEAEIALRQAILGWRAMGAVACRGRPDPAGARMCVHSTGQTQEADAWFDTGHRGRRTPAQRPDPRLGLQPPRCRPQTPRGDSTRPSTATAPRSRLYVDRGVPAGLSLSLASLGYISECRGDVGARGRDIIVAALARGAAMPTTSGRKPWRSRVSRVWRRRSVTTMASAATWVRPRRCGGSTGGALVPAERADVERALERVSDGVVMKAAFAAGRGDPSAVIAAARDSRARRSSNEVRRMQASVRARSNLS